MKTQKYHQILSFQVRTNMSYYKYHHTPKPKACYFTNQGLKSTFHYEFI